MLSIGEQKMIVLSKYLQQNVKKVHCPVCGGRLCDVNSSEKVFMNKKNVKSEIVLKCHKCKSKIGVSMQSY